MTRAPSAAGGLQLAGLLHVLVVGGTVLSAGAVLWSRSYEPVSSHDAVAVGCGATVLGLIAYARYGLRFPWLSASIVYLALFWMFHFGLTFTAALYPAVLAPLQDWELAWLDWPNVRLAMMLGVLGAAGFVAGLAIAGSRATGERPGAAAPAEEPAMLRLGWLLMAAGIGGAVFTLSTGGGVGVLGLSYMEFRTGVLGPSRFQTYLDLTQLGGILALCGGARGRAWLGPIAAWAPLAAVLLLVGLRTEALVPTVAFTIVLTHRGVRLPRSVLVAGIVAALVLIPVVRTIRNVGVANEAEVDWRAATPLETFTELGGTLRAVKAYVDWIEEGDEFLLGATYWAPFDRQLITRLVPGREPIPYELDDRLPERHIEREGAVGLAAAGEAYYNFGPVGPFMYFGIIGILFGWLERRASTTPYHCAALGVAMGIFYFNIRSHWLFVPAQVILALVPVAACYGWRLVAPRPRARAVVGA